MNRYDANTLVELIDALNAIVNDHGVVVEGGTAEIGGTKFALSYSADNDEYLAAVIK